MVEPLAEDVVACGESLEEGLNVDLVEVLVLLHVVVVVAAAEEEYKKLV